MGRDSLQKHNGLRGSAGSAVQRKPWRGTRRRRL